MFLLLDGALVAGGINVIKVVLTEDTHCGHARWWHRHCVDELALKPIQQIIEITMGSDS